MSIKKSIVRPLFLLAAIGIMALGWTAISALRTYDQSGKSSIEAVRVFQTARDTETAFRRLQELNTKVIDMATIFEAEHIRWEFNGSTLQLRRKMAEFRQYSQSVSMQNILNDLEQDLELWFNDSAIILGLVSAPDVPTSHRIQQHTESISQKIGDLLEFTESQPAIIAEIARKSFVQTLVITSLALLAVVVSATIVSHRRANHLVKSIGSLQTSMEHLAAGHYDTPIKGTTRKDELGIMARSVAAFARGLEQLHEAQDRIEHLAMHDPLTDLPNRRFLTEHLDKALAHAKRGKSSVAVLHIDLDKFKQVNDTLGHDAGDKVLLEATQRMSTALRKSDIVIRAGGDEFIIVATDYPNRRDVERTAKRLIAQLSQPLEIGGNEVQIGASVGIAFHPTDGKTAEELLMNADIALYKAKNDGRGRYVRFKDDLRLAFVEQERMVRELRRAITQKEIVPYFQPQISLDSQQVIGFEVLARWQHPRKGLLGPADFLEVANQNDLAVPLGEVMLESALTTLGSWKELGIPDVKLSINASFQELRNPDYAPHVGRTLLRHAIPAYRISVEILETLMIESEGEVVIRNLEHLGELGVGLDIDDFGTGSASLSLLKRLNVDRIKIDRSFVCDSTASDKSKILVKTLIRLADDMNIVSLQEGIETAEELAFLRETTCNQVQGYLYAKPMSADDAAEWQLQHRARKSA